MALGNTVSASGYSERSACMLLLFEPGDLDSGFLSLEVVGPEIRSLNPGPGCMNVGRVIH